MGNCGQEACGVGIVVMSTTPRSSSFTQSDRRRVWCAPVLSRTIRMTKFISEPSPSSDERPDRPRPPKRRSLALHHVHTGRFQRVDRVRYGCDCADVLDMGMGAGGSYRNSRK